MQLMALGANSPGLWQSQLAAVAARQLSQQDRDSGPSRSSGAPILPPPPSLPPQVSPNEIQAIQQALQQQQQNIQQHLQNLLLLQQSSLGGAGSSSPLSPPFMGNQVISKNAYYRATIEWSYFQAAAV